MVHLALVAGLFAVDPSPVVFASPAPPQASLRSTTEVPTILPLFPPELMPWEIDEDLTGDPNYTFFGYCDS